MVSGRRSASPNAARQGANPPRPASPPVASNNRFSALEGTVQQAAQSPAAEEHQPAPPRTPVHHKSQAARKAKDKAQSLAIKKRRDQKALDQLTGLGISGHMPTTSRAKDAARPYNSTDSPLAPQRNLARITRSASRQQEETQVLTAIGAQDEQEEEEEVMDQAQDAPIPAPQFAQPDIEQDETMDPPQQVSPGPSAHPSPQAPTVTIDQLLSPNTLAALHQEQEDWEANTGLGNSPRSPTARQNPQVQGGVRPYVPIQILNSPTPPPRRRPRRRSSSPDLGMIRRERELQEYREDQKLAGDPIVHNFRPARYNDEPPNPHTPTLHDRSPIHYTTPVTLYQDYELPRMIDPNAHKDNVIHSLLEHWESKIEPAVMVYIAGMGLVTGKGTRTWTELVKSTSRGTLGGMAKMSVTPPHPQYPVSGPRQPPFCYYVNDITYRERNQLLHTRCIATKECVLFFVPTTPIIDDFVGTIAYFNDVSEHVLVNFVDRALHDVRLATLVEEMAGPERADSVLDSLEVELRTVTDREGYTFNVAHLHMTPPTKTTAEWRKFQKLFMSANFTGPEIGYGTLVITDWRCEICLSALHLSHLCPIINEPGWLYPPQLDKFKLTPPSAEPSASSSTPVPQINREPQEAPASAYSSINPTQKKQGTDKNGKKWDKKGGKGKGQPKPKYKGKGKGKARD